MKKQKPTIISVDAKQLTFLSYFTIKKKNFGDKFKIRRMPLNDLILVCGVHHIEIVGFDKQSQTFDMYHFFKNIHKSLISDAVFAGDNIYSVCPESEYIHQIKMRNKESYARDVASIMDFWLKTDAAKVMARNDHFNQKKQATDFHDGIEVNDKYVKNEKGKTF